MVCDLDFLLISVKLPLKWYEKQQDYDFINLMPCIYVIIFCMSSTDYKLRKKKSYHYLAIACILCCLPHEMQKATFSLVRSRHR